MLRKERKQGAGDAVTAFAFLFCAAGAVFGIMHKDDIMEGRIVDVVLSYMQDSETS